MAGNSHFRYVILFVGFLALMVIFSNYTIINLTFICMKNDLTNAEEINGTFRSRYDYSPAEKKAIIWAVAAGTVVGTLPVNWLYLRQGARMPFLLAGGLSILSTTALPTAADNSYHLLLLVRFVQGLAYSADFAVIGIICVTWAPLDESAMFIAILTSFSSFASVATNSITGALCESSFGWKSSYYVHAFFGCICFIAWTFIYSDKPTEHRFVGSQEAQRIQKGKGGDNVKERRIPWLAMLRNKSVVCVWLNAFMEMTSTIMLITYAPIYFRNVLEFEVEQTGYFVSLSIGLQLPFKLGTALISDKYKKISDMKKMLIFNTISVGLVGVFFCVLGFVPRSQRFWAVVVVALINCLSSMNCGGFYKCATLVARQYADVVIATIQFFKCVALFTGPALVAATVQEESDRGQWTAVFCINGVLLILANFASYAMFSDKRAVFTRDGKTQDYDLVEKS